MEQELSAPSSGTLRHPMLIFIPARPRTGRRPLTMQRARRGRSALACAFALLPMLCVAGVAGADEPPGAGSGAPSPSARKEKLLYPDHATQRAPETFRVLFDTSEGEFLVEVTRAWAPLGADRFYNLVELGFYDDVAFFRVIAGLVAQFGINGDPKVSMMWRGAKMDDEPVVESNKRGYLSFAALPYPDSRSTQVFVNLKDNEYLDKMGFSPFGRVVEGMETLESVIVVGEGKPNGPGPSQRSVSMRGNRFLKARYPDLSYIKRATLVSPKDGKDLTPPAEAGSQTHIGPKSGTKQ
jgi:peptidyl-prolyl cis-trans isomerase A (cyclophilin A)